MKKMQRIYLILTYSFYILSPFIWGLIEIYSEYSNDSNHILGFIINVVVLALIFLICMFLVNRGKLHAPDTLEKKYLIFGLVGNLMMYFYVYQNSLEIDKIITVYLVLLVVLSVHYLLIQRKFRPLELWILLPVFMFNDYLFLLVRGCGWGEYGCDANESGDPFLMFFTTIIFIYIILIYVYKVITYRLFDYFKILNIVLVASLSLLVIMDSLDMYYNDELNMTIMIVGFFAVILDFIIKIVNKHNVKKMLLFYMRTFAIMILVFSFVETGILRGRLGNSSLMFMVVTTYFSLTIIIFGYIMKVKLPSGHPMEVIKKSFEIIRFSEFSDEDIKQIESQFDKKESITANSIIVLAKKHDDIFGYIHMYKTKLTEPLHNVYEATIESINFSGLDENVLDKLFDYAEKTVKSKGIQMIRINLNKDQEDLLNFFIKDQYVPVEYEDSFMLIKKM